MNEQSTHFTIEQNTFYIISFIFILLFFYYAYNSGITYGINVVGFIWAFTVSTTPISTASILLSFPLKIFTSIPMHITKFVISILSLFVLFYYYKYKYHIINTIPIGKVFINIIKSNLYIIFAISIISSVMCSYLIDTMINYLMIPTSSIDYNTSISILIFFLLLNVIYLKLLLSNKILGIKSKYYIL